MDPGPAHSGREPGSVRALEQTCKAHSYKERLAKGPLPSDKDLDRVSRRLRLGKAATTCDVTERLRGRAPLSSQSRGTHDASISEAQQDGPRGGAPESPIGQLRFPSVRNPDPLLTGATPGADRRGLPRRRGRSLRYPPRPARPCGRGSPPAMPVVREDPR